MSKLTTPLYYSPAIEVFVNNFIPGTPVWQFLPFTKPDNFEPTPQQCHVNTYRYKQTYRNEIAFGWIIRATPDMRFFEAEFHSVILDSYTLIDITPRIDEEENLLFILDYSRKATVTGTGREFTIETYDKYKLDQGNLIEGQKSLKKFPEP